MSTSFPGYRNGFPGKVHEAMEDGTPFEVFAGVDPGGQSDLDPPLPHFVGIGTPYPYGFESLEEVGNFYWRIREWEFSLNGVVFVPPSAGTPVSIPDETQTWEVGLRAPSDLTDSESDLCKEYSWGSVLTPDFDSIEFFSGSINLRLRFFTASTFNAADIHELRYFDDGSGYKYYPHIELEIWAVGPPDYAATTISYYSNGAYAFTPVLTTVDFFGVTINLFTNNYDDHSWSAGTIDVGVDTWWGYDGTFDTATGARL